MKAYATQSIRNVGIAGHGDTGKTQLVSSLLFTAGMTTRLGKVAEGNTVTDWDEEEIARKITIHTGQAYAEWASGGQAAAASQAEKVKINFLDTPGYSTFLNDTRASLVAADAALILVDALAGVQVGTEKVWDYATEYDLPRAFAINWMDRELASYDQRHGVDHARVRPQRRAAAIADRRGEKFPRRGGPDHHEGARVHARRRRQAQDRRNSRRSGRRRESRARDAGRDGRRRRRRADGGVFREGHAADRRPDERAARRFQAKRIYPVVLTSALHNIGSATLLDLLADVFPDPSRRGVAIGHTETGGKGDEVQRKISDAEPVSIFVYKTLADPFSGRISYFKVMSGVLKNDATLQNFTRNTSERLQHVQMMQGKTATAVAELHAGDLGAIAKLKDTLTGDTLGDKAAPIHYPPPHLPEPSITFAVEPKTRADEDRIGPAIHRILEEDPSLHFSRDPQTKEFLLAGSGQQHIEVVVAKLHKRYHVDLTLKPPKVPYRETIRGKADAEGKHKKQTGGHGQFGVCRIRMEPAARGAGVEFVDDIFGGAIPKNWIPSVEKGIRASAERGYLAGFPVVDFRATLYDGKYHDVDSSDMAFQIAGSLAFKEAMKQAKPALLEPVMHVEVNAPDQYSGDIMGDLSSRRGRISGSEARGASVVIKAQVPFAEMLNYATGLTSMTQGRASYSMEFSHYDYVPGEIAEKVIAAAKAARGVAVEEEV